MVQVTREFVHHCLPVRKRDGHKGTFGKVHILAGSVGLTGAAALTAAAAVRTGSGLYLCRFLQRSGPCWR